MHAMFKNSTDFKEVARCIAIAVFNHYSTGMSALSHIHTQLPQVGSAWGHMYIQYIHQVKYKCLCYN